MELKNLFQNTSYLLVTRIVKFIVGFIRVKLIAVFLGATGTGVISQLTQITEVMARFTVSGMNDGLVKQIAESDKNEETYRRKFAVMVKSYLTIISAVLLFVLALALLYSKEITIYFLGDIKYYIFFLIALASFPILNLKGVHFAILKSYKRIKFIAHSEIIILVIEILIFIPLIYFWGLTGAAIYITFAYLTMLFVYHFYVRKIFSTEIKISIKDILKATVSNKVIKELFVFAGFGLTAGIALILTDTATRAIVVNQLGIREIGIYSPVLIWTSLFAGLIMPSIGTYLYPRFCECKSDSEIKMLMNDAIRFVTLLMIPVILFSIPVRFQLIPVFYSKEFISAGNYLPWHFLGSLFYMWMFIFDQAMKPTGRIKTSGIIIILMCLLDATVVYIFVPEIGLYGYMLKFLVSPILFFIIYLIYWKKQINFTLDRKNAILMSYLLISFTLLVVIEKFLISNYLINSLIGLFLVFSAYVFLDKSERNLLINKFKSITAISIT